MISGANADDTVEAPEDNVATVEVGGVVVDEAWVEGAGAPSGDGDGTLGVCRVLGDRWEPRLAADAGGIWLTPQRKRQALHTFRIPFQASIMPLKSL